MHRSQTMPLAIVGMACRLPQADGLEAFWTLLVEGRSAVAEIPEARLNRKLYFNPKKGVRGKSYTTVACLVDYPPPDPALCPLTEEEIALHDPAHVTMVEIAAKACLHAGFDPFGMPQRRTGVYVGHTRGSTLGGDLTYAHLVEHTAQYLRDIKDFARRTGTDAGEVIEEIVRSVRSRHAERQPGRLPNLSGFQAAGLVARALKLDGPVMTVNAACASSLQALNLAASALQLGEIDMAVVGGAAYCKLDSLVLFSYAQSVSATGSRPFDAEADGLVNGEGYVALVIEPLERALANGSPIHAVIRGIGMSCDGSGKSLWAPRKEGQVLAMQRAYEHGVAMDRVQYIEAHATSTQVGDATELAALGEALQGQLPEGKKIPVGSVKANIGHTIEAAGLAGLLKTILSLQHCTIPPAINVRQLNPKIDWARMPFYVPRTALPWPEQPDGHPRCAGVNSFGIGGLNVHMVVEEFLPNRAPAAHAGPAHTDESGFQQSPPEPIAVIGIGTILPGALNPEAYWELLVAGRDPKQNAPQDRWNVALAHTPGARLPFRTPNVLGGFITDFQYDWKTRKIPPKQIAHADLLQFMLLEAVEQALGMCGTEAGRIRQERTGVYVGALTAGEFHEQLQMGLRLPEFQEELGRVLRERGVSTPEIEAIGREFGAILLARMPALMDETGSYTTNTLASRITKTFNFMGGAAAIDAGPASAAAALSASINSLRTGECDAVVCAAGQRAMGPVSYEFFSLEGKLAMGEPRSPFDADARGFVPGEGAAAVVLKRLSDAQRDGDTVLGLIRSVGAACHDHYQTAVTEALRRGLSAAGAQVERIACIETAGEGLPGLDDQEIAAMLASLEAPHRPQPVALGAITSQLGQLGAGHAMAGLIKLVLALQHGQFPRNVALGEPCALLKCQSLLTAPKETFELPGRIDDRPPLAGLTSCADTRLVYHFVVEGPTPDTPAPAVTRVADTTGAEWRVVRFEGRDLRQLMEALPCTAARAEAAYAAPQPSFDRGGQTRLAIVAESPQDLAEKSQLTRRQSLHPEAFGPLREKGIFCFHARSSRPRVAFLFAGQGSQYVGMLQSLIQEVEPARNALSRIDEVLSRLGYPSAADVLWERGGELGKDVWRTQLSMLIADTVYFLCLAALEIFPDRVAGHSFGEFGALLAAGAWDFENAVRATRARCAVIEARPETQGIMMSVNASAAVVEAQLEGLAEPAYISCYNSEEQTVVGGSKRAVLELAERLRRQQLLTQLVNTPAPFHTPLMEAVQAPFSEALTGIALAPPSVPVLSSVHNRYVAEPAEIRSTLAAQLTAPVRYLELVQRLAREGIEIFVEVGPRQVLTRLNRRILAGTDAITLCTDQPRRSGPQQLLGVRACLEAAGALNRDPVGPTARIFPSTRTVVAPEIGRPRRHGRSVKNTSADEEERRGGPPHPFDVVELSGSPYEMGFQHGRAQSSQILTLLRRYADLAGTWETVEDVLELTRHPEDVFAANDLEELQGIAEGAGVALAAVIAHNVRLHSALGGCVHFGFAAAHNGTGSLVHAANEDQTLGLRMRGCLVRTVQARFPDGGIPHLTFCTSGQLGGFSGVNALGLAVTSAQLLDREYCGSKGPLHAQLIKHILERAGGIEEAAQIIEAAHGAGAWAVCITDHATDEVCYAEYHSGGANIQRHQTRIIGANHSLRMPVAGRAPAHSVHRLARLKQLLGDERQLSGEIGIPEAQAALRDRFDLGRGRETRHPTMNTVRRIDNQMSLVMQPARGKAWVTDGTRAEIDADRFFELDIRELLTAKNQASEERDRKPSGSDPVSMSTSGAGGFGSGETAVCQRFVLRIAESPLGTNARSRFPAGRALILGENAVAEALRHRIEGAGGAAIVLTPSSNLDELLARVDDFCRGEPPLHLFLVTPCDDEARTDLARARWQSRRILGVSVPYFVCQRWYQRLLEAGRVESASIVGVTSLGGDFGLAASVTSAESGAVTGLIKALKRELDAKGLRGLTAKIIDTARDAPAEETIAAIVRELEAADDEVEVTWIGGRRATVHTVAEPAVPRTGGAGIARGGVWVVTGGARGITAAVAQELARRYDLRLHLLGSSPLGQVDRSWHALSQAGLKALRANVMQQALARGEVPIAAWNRVTRDLEIDRNLTAYSESGVRVSYHCCDITDYERVDSLLQEIRASDGPIAGILHGAAFESAIRFERKRSELVARTITVKVDGAANLMALTREDPIRHFLAFGSISGRFGGIGQTDYSLANDFLAKLVDWYRTERPEVRAVTFHWHAWDDVGMAVRPEKSYIRQYFNVRYMPAREGIRHFVDEVSAGLPEREIVVTDPSQFEEILSPQFARGNPPSSKAVGAARGDGHDVAGLPLVDAVRRSTSRNAITAEVSLDPVKDPFLAGHRFKNRPLLPGVVSVAALAQTASLLLGEEAVGVLEHVEFVAPLRFHTDKVQVARLHVRMQDKGVACQLTADFISRGGKLIEKDRVHARALVRARAGALQHRSPVEEKPQTWHAFQYPESGILYHGEFFRCLKAVSIDERGAWGRIASPSMAVFAGSRPGGRWIVPAPVIDAAFVVCGVHARLCSQSRAFYVPKGIERLYLGRPCKAGEQLTVRTITRASSEENTVYDFTIFDEHDEIIADVVGYTGFIVASADETRASTATSTADKAHATWSKGV